MFKLVPEGIGMGETRSRLQDFFEEILMEGLKKRLKEEEKKPDHKHKSKLYNGAEVCSFLMIMALPAGIAQLWMLSYFRDMLLTFAK